MNFCPVETTRPTVMRGVFDSQALGGDHGTLLGQYGRGLAEAACGHVHPGPIARTLGPDDKESSGGEGGYSIWGPVEGQSFDN